MSESNLTEHDHSQSMVDLDLADEDQIISEISGRVSDKYIYELKGVKDDRGNPVIGLSYAGTNWACREFARQGEVIRIGKWEDRSTPDEPEYYKIAVLAQRFSVDKETGKELALDSNISGKRQWKFMKKNKWENGEKVGEETVPDPFAWEKCLSKATRNAKQALMPTEMVKKLIAKAMENKSGQSTPRSSPPKGNQQPPPKANAKPVTPPAGGSATAGATAGNTEQGSTAKPEEVKKPEEPKKTEEAKKTTPPPTQNTTTPPPPAEPGKPKMSMEVMVQKLDAVCKMVFNTQDGGVARQKLAAITGKASPADLNAEDIKKVGNAINAVAKKTATIEGNNIVKTSDKSILWKGPDVPPPAAPAAAPEEPAKEEEMF